MKTSKLVVTSIVGGMVLLAGCTATQTPASVAKNITHNLNILESTVSKLDTIDNNYLSNPDILPTQNQTHTATVNLNNLPIRSDVKKVANTTLDNTDNINNEECNNCENKSTISYNPRYLQDLSPLENGDYLSNYISKVKTLYAITNDVIEANSTLGNCKNYILTYVVEIKDLNNELINGVFEPNNQQIAALNNYINDIKTTIKRIKRCNGELSEEVNNIGKTDSGTITTGIDVIKSNYLTVLNHIDTRITYLKNALTTLEQIKSILIETQTISNNENNSETNNPNVETPLLENNNSTDLATNPEPEQVKQEEEIETQNKYIDNNNQSTKQYNSINNTDTLNNVNNDNINNNTDNNVTEDNYTTNSIDATNNTNTLSNTQNNQFQNDIITQNNLNNGNYNTINGYTFTQEENINDDNIINNNQTKKNIDTYGYNTMIDMINNGTVNNGINTLNTTQKPNMVNNNEYEVELL